MDLYNQAMAEAYDRGYLVAGRGGSWLDCEVRWRRYCMAAGRPAVVVSRRSKLADVYMFLRNVPHTDISDESVRKMLKAAGSLDLGESQISIIRGDRGKPTLFVGLSISDIPVVQALDLAPVLLARARTLIT